MADRDIAVNAVADDQIVAAVTALISPYMDFRANCVASFLLRECSVR